MCWTVGDDLRTFLASGVDPGIHEWLAKEGITAVLAAPLFAVAPATSRSTRPRCVSEGRLLQAEQNSVPGVSEPPASEQGLSANGWKEATHCGVNIAVARSPSATPAANPSLHGNDISMARKPAADLTDIVMDVLRGTPQKFKEIYAKVAQRRPENCPPVSGDGRCIVKVADMQWLHQLEAGPQCLVFFAALPAFIASLYSR